MRLTHVVSGIGIGLLASITAFAATTGSFTDVSANRSDAEAINHMKSEGVVEGFEDGTHRPDRTITRAEFTKIILLSVYSQEEIDELLMRIRITSMPDVTGDEWYADYVNFARSKGIVSGYPDGYFRPHDPVNFAEASKIMVNTFGVAMDKRLYEIWYEGYVRALARMNAIPTSINGFDARMTRGEMAEIAYRLKTGTADKPSLTYEDLAGGGTYDGCVRTGCSAHICADEEMASTCEWREEYACYKTATCERQDNGECGWTETDELTSCLAGDADAASCAAVLCPTNTRCENGACIPLSSSSSSSFDTCPVINCANGYTCKNSKCIPIGN